MEREALEAVFEEHIRFTEERCVLRLENDVEMIFSSPSCLVSISGPSLSKKMQQRVVERANGLQLSSVFELQDAVLNLLQDADAEELPVEEEVAPADYSDVEFFQGEKVTDRKSKFIAFCGKCHSRAEAYRFVEALKRRVKKVDVATHNIMAFQIRDGEAYRDDDGEGGAGDVLLKLLENLKVYNVVVVVTRWYGGTQLGPDRFRHIQNCAKEVILNNRHHFD